MQAPDNTCSPDDPQKKDDRQEMSVNELPGAMKKIKVKASTKSLTILPTGISRVKLGAQSTSIKGLSSSASATGNPRNKTALAPGHSLMDWIRLGASNVDLTGVGGVHQVVTLTELAKHNQRSDAWIAIRGVVFNVTRYMDFHPGGVEELMKGVGIDATKLFDGVHAWVNYQSILQKCVVGRLTRGITTEPSDNPFTSGTKLNSTAGNGSTAPIKVDDTWKQTTNTILFVYKTTRDQSFPGYQLIRENEREFIVQINLPDVVTRHEYDLNGDVKWPPTWSKNFDTLEIEFCFVKSNKELWSSYGSRSVGSQVKSVERKYRDWEVISNTSLCESVNLLVLKSKNYIEIMPVGRHLEAKMNVMGVEVARPYTPVPPFLHPSDEAPGYKSDCLCLMIKRYDDGALSPSITALQQGQSLILSNGLGMFLIESFDSYSAIHMLAAGTGLTPLLGIIQRALCRRNVTTMNLLNFNRNEKNIFYGPQLDTVCADKRLTVTHILSQADDSWTGRRGIVSELLLKELISDVDKQGCVFVCGPKPFMDACQEALQKLGWQDSQVHKFDG